jgi:hypothetical protein
LFDIFFSDFKQSVIVSGHELNHIKNVASNHVSMEEANKVKNKNHKKLNPK